MKALNLTSIKIFFMELLNELFCNLKTSVIIYGNGKGTSCLFNLYNVTVMAWEFEICTGKTIGATDDSNPIFSNHLVIINTLVSSIFVNYSHEAIKLTLFIKQDIMLIAL